IALVWRLMGDHAFAERQHQLAAAGNALPDLGLGLLLGAGLLVLADAEDLVLIAALVATPAHLDFDPFGVTIHTEGHAQAARYQRLIAGSVDLIGGVRLGLDTPRRRAELRTGFMLAGRLRVGGLFDLVVRQWPFEPFDATL